MQTFDQYLPAARYGAKIQGHNASTNQFYGTFAIAATVAGANVFSTATAPTSGTITGFYTSAGNTTSGNAVLWGTTSGTIATIAYGTTIGLMTGTNVLNAAVAAGDTLIVTSSTVGSATGYVSFVTAS